MAKKTKSTTVETDAPVTQEQQMPIFVQMASLIGPEGQLLDDNEFSVLGHRSPSSQEHVNQPFDVGAYDVQRPAEADPKTWEKIFEACDNWYQKNGLIRNIIDLMADFCVAGVQVSSPDPNEQAVLRKWFEIVNGEHVSERIANMLYRLGNVGIRKQFGKVKVDFKEQLQKAAAQMKTEVRAPDEIVDERVMPYKYITISPKHINVPSPEISAFLDEPYYGLRIRKNPRRALNQLDNEINDEVLMKKLPSDIREALKTGKTVKLDNDRFKMLHYKKDDFDKRFAFPLIYAALSDLFLYSKMQLADRNVVDSAIKHITFIKIGDVKTGLIPPMEHVEDMTKKIAKAGAGGSKSCIVTHPFIDLISDTGTLATFLGKAKFEIVLEAIYATFGIPAALTGTASGAAANN